jgi:HTH-type transcriptional regulator, sugar sensing transcriptional regulator
MVVSQNVLDSLKQIGLNLYERKLWVSLLSRGTSTAGELSSLAKVPHSRTYDVLESLSEKGFVMTQNTKPLKYVAVKPAEAFGRAKKKIEKDTSVSIGRIDKLQKSNIVKELDKLYKDGVSLVSPGEMNGSLKGRHMIHQQMGTVIRDSKKHISIATTHEGIRELHSKHVEHLRKAAERGVRIRIAAPYRKDTSDAMHGLKSFADVRKLDKTMGRLCLVDGKHALLSLTDDTTVHPTQDLGFWANSEHIAENTMGPMFNSMWNGLQKI